MKNILEVEIEIANLKNFNIFDVKNKMYNFFFIKLNFYDLIFTTFNLLFL